MVQNNTVRWWKRSEAMRWTGFSFQSRQKISTIGDGDRNPVKVDSNIWLNEKNAPLWELTQSSVHMPYYDQTLILITASPTGISDGLEEPDLTKTTMPTFH